MRAFLLLCLACATTPTDSADPGDTGSDTDTGDSGADTGDTGDTDTGAGEYAEVIAEVQKAVKSDLRGSQFASGVSVAVWKDGEIVYAEGFGTKHPDGDEAVSTTTLFQIGSDTKKITAVAALQRVEAGAVGLEDSVGDAVPALAFVVEPGLEDELTLHELLSHSTGVFDYTPWVDAPDDADLYDRAVGRFADNEYKLGPSGLFWNYSNPNFSMAGLVTQEVDGRMWADIIEDDIFAPLGLSRSFARVASVIADGDYAVGAGVGFPDGYDSFDPLAELGYTVGTVEIEDTYDCGFTRPAGLVWSTASDMATFGGFLLDGDPNVLSDALLAEVTTPQVPMYPATDPAKYGYGYGLMINNVGWSGYQGMHGGVPLWAHGGNTMTMTSTFYILPEQRVVVSVLSNGYGDDFTKTAVTAMEGFADLPPIEDGEEILQPASGEAELVGTWYDPHVLGTLLLTWDGVTLLAEAPDLEAAGANVTPEVTAYAQDLYFLTVDGADYDFSYYADESGEYLINRQFSFKKAPIEAVAPPPAVRAHLPAPPMEPDLRARAFGLGR